MKSLGHIAYDAYCESAGGVSLVSGAKLPEWSGLHEKIRAAWECAAAAVMNLRAPNGE